MAYRNGPKITTDGLVLCLDAAISKSYPGSGTTWYDLSTANNNSTRSGPIYSSNNKGIFSFDGTDDYFDTGISTGTYDANGNSFFAWVYTTTYDRQKIWSWYALVNNIQNRGDFELQSTSNNLKFQAYGQTTDNDTGFTITTNKWWHVGFVWNPGQTVTIYVNGESKFNGTQTLSSQANGGNFRIGWRPYQNEKPWQGYMSQVTLYDRQLLANEVRQNFNATRGRFGV